MLQHLIINVEKVFARVTGMPAPSVADALIPLDEARIILEKIQFASDPNCLFGKEGGEVV
jgi:hypothetical protein